MPGNVQSLSLYYDARQHNQFRRSGIENAVIREVEAISDFARNKFEVLVVFEIRNCVVEVSLIDAAQPSIAPFQIFWSCLPSFSTYMYISTVLPSD